MNILIVSDSFWPDNAGGIDKSLLSETDGLAGRGHRITVVTRRLKKDLLRYEARGAYDLYRYPGPSRGTAFYHAYPLSSLNQTGFIKRLHRLNRFSAAYVHNPFQAISVARSGIPYVYVFHAPLSREIQIDAARGKYGRRSTLLRPIVRWINAVEYQALSRARAVIVRSRYMCEQARTIHRDRIDQRKIFRIPLGVDTRRFSFAADPSANRRSLGLPAKTRILLTVRRLVARNGLENLIAAMVDVTKERPDLLLLICGAGYLKKILSDQIRRAGLDHCVRLAGFIPEEVLPSYYQTADLFVLPTLELEGFGLSTIEALSCGTPVIATPVGANAEVLGPFASEGICQTSTPAALARKIIDRIEPAASPATRKRCRDYCVSNYAIERVVAAIERRLNDIAGR